MAIYYKFKSAKDYDTITMDSPFIKVGFLKERIYETKHLGSGKDLDIVISNAQTNEEYLDEEMLIPKNTSVLIRRVPGRPRIRVHMQQEPIYEEKVENVQTVVTNNLTTTVDASTAEDEFDVFGEDFYSVPNAPTLQSTKPCPDPAVADEHVDEDTKLKAFLDTSALNWQQQVADGPGRGYGRGMAGRMGGRGFGMETKTPPQGYVCHRCHVPGHFIQHCPTNGDPSFDVKRVKPPTGIPKSMLMTTPNGSYSLPSGAVAVLKPNEDAFEKEMEGLPSTTRTVVELPPELKCPLCKEVMRDAALTSKCCFQSFCDKCIRDHIIAKSMCVCGKTVLADDLLPNMTLRETINRILESGNSSGENAGSMCQVQDMESARCQPPPKAISPTTSAASKGEKKQTLSNNNNETSTLKPSIEIAEITSAPRESTEVVKVENLVCESENSRGSLNGKEAVNNKELPKEETPQQVASGDQVKKKKKKPRVPGTDMQWNPMAGPDYMMPMGPSPYFNCVQQGFVQPGFNGVFHNGFNGFMGPFAVPPYIGYGGPMDMSSFMHHHPDPFAGQGFGFPHIPPPHRDLAEIGNRMMNLQPHVMGREEFEAKKAEMKRKRENEKRSQGENVCRDGESTRMMMMNHSSPMKPKSRQAQPPPDSRRRRSERSSPRRVDSPPRSSSRRRSSRDRERDHDYEHDRRRRREADRKQQKRSSEEPNAATTDDNHKSSVFNRINFLAEEESSKRKTTSPAPEISVAVSSARRHCRRETDYDSSDDEDRHFKRKPSRYKRSPSVVATVSDVVVVGDENSRHLKRSKGERSRND